MPKKESAPEKINLIQNIFQIFLLALLFTISAGTIFLVLFQIKFSGKIYPRVSAAETNIGYFDAKAAQVFIGNKIDAWENKKIQIEYIDQNNPETPKKWEVSPEELGFTPSGAKTILELYNFGRAGSALKNTTEKIKIIINGKNMPLYYDLNEDKFNSYITSKFSFLEKPPRDASLEFDGDNIREIASASGYIIDRANLKNAIIADGQNLLNNTVRIKIDPYDPVITNEKIQQAKAQAAVIMKSKISLKFEEKLWTLEKEMIKSSIDFLPMPNPGKQNETILGVKFKTEPITDLLEKIQIEVNREPKNAVFDYKDGQIIVESGGETGAVVSIEQSAKKLAEEVLQKSLTNNAIITELAIKSKDPEIGKKKLEDLKIDTLLGQGRSNFAGSPKNRRRNIAVGAAKFNNIIIAEGEEFSFVKTLGEITAANGYVPELVIKNKSVVAELGGGLCQVSTTAFRAAIYSGLPILERRAHAYAVPYYAPQGMDATIYPPHPDLRFKNDTGGQILVQTKIIKNDLIFNFFGKKQTRKIKVIGPNTYDRQPDGSMKAVFYREFYEGENLIKKEPFYSAYKSPNDYPHKNPLE